MNELRARAENAQYVFYSFSGGRDSAYAMYLTIDKYKNQGKKIEAIYVNSGNEFPDLIEHVKRVCAFVDVPLTVLTGESFESVYVQSGKFPDSIHMDCIEKLINKPMDKYMKSITNGENYILVRGGKRTQKRPESSTQLYQYVKTKPNMIIYNPLFEYDDLLIPEEVKSILDWDGYAKGFVRTACWCCPFQKPEQWQAMKTHYPELHKKMKKMVATLTFILHPGDGHVKRLSRYWIEKEYTPIKLDYAEKRKKEFFGADYDGTI